MSKNLVLLVVAVCAMAVGLTAQEVQVKPIAAQFLPVTNPEWGTDIAITNREPLGRPSGAGRSNGTGFVAIPDTGLFPNFQLVVYRTTDFGNTWASTLGITPAAVVQKSKMVKTSTDSVIVFWLSGGVLRYWNVETLTYRQFDTTSIRDFDVATTSTGGLYLFYMSSNSVRRAASADFGVTWPQRGTVQTGSAFPRIFWNLQATSDTMFLNYYAPVKPDTFRSVIRQARYRETAPGAVASSGFIDIDTDTSIYRAEYRTVKVQNVVWFLNTRGTTGAIDIQCRVSTDAGVTYGAPFLAAGNPNVDEYWFDATNFTLGVGGLDFAYYADSVGGTPSNLSDKIMYAYANRTSPSTISAPAQISQHFPGWSSRNYIPTIFEYNDASGDVGILWVGTDVSQKKVYYDRYSAPAVSVSPSNTGIPEVYSLSQNYPNPFNPATRIEFTIPQSGFVTLKVFDLLGREVSTLVAEDMKAGAYKANFNASRLASGVYLYQLRAGGYVETKKLTVLK